MPNGDSPYRPHGRRAVSHGIHVQPYVVLSDGCEECLQRAKSGLDGLMALDSINLRRLGELERRMGDNPDVRLPEMSGLDHLAVRNLTMARIVVEQADMPRGTI